MDEQRWSDRQREIEEAQRRGELFADVRTIARGLDEMRNDVKNIHVNINLIMRDMVSRKDFDVMKVEVEGLTVRWKVIAGIMGLIVFLSQAIPRFLDIIK